MSLLPTEPPPFELGIAGCPSPAMWRAFDAGTLSPSERESLE